jgi:hypothetical protein
MAVVLLGTGFARTAWAGCPNSRQSDELAKCHESDGKYYQSHGDRCDNLDKICGEKSSSSTSSGGDSDDSAAQAKRDCRELKSKVDDAFSKFSERCSDAGISMNCDKKVSLCEQPAQEEYRNENAFLTALGGAFGISKPMAASRCSSMTGREYKDQKKELQDKLKDANKDLAQNERDVAELNEKYNEQVAEIDKEVADNQKKYTEDQLAAGKSGRDAKTAVEQSLIQARATRRSKEAKLVKLNSDLGAIIRSKNEKLSALLDSKATLACFDRASSITSAKKVFGSVSQQTSGGGNKKNLQEMTYTSCKAEFAAKRLATIEEHEAALRDKNKEIADTQSEIDDLDQQVASAQNEYDLQLKDQAAAGTNALKALNATIEQANKKRTALDQLTKQKGDSLTKVATLAKEEATMASNEMTLLGSPPPKSSGDVSVATASEAKKQLDRYKAHYYAECPDDFKKFFKEEAAEMEKAEKKAAKAAEKKGGAH